MCRLLPFRGPCAARCRNVATHHLRSARSCRHVSLPGETQDWSKGPTPHRILCVSQCTSFAGTSHCCLPTGRLLHLRAVRGPLQVFSAAAEAVKVYEKEYKLGQRHKLKVCPFLSNCIAFSWQTASYGCCESCTSMQHLQASCSLPYLLQTRPHAHALTASTNLNLVMLLPCRLWLTRMTVEVSTSRCKPIIQAGYCCIGVWRVGPTTRAAGAFLEMLPSQRALSNTKPAPCRHPSSKQVQTGTCKAGRHFVN